MTDAAGDPTHVFVAEVLIPAALHAGRGRTDRQRLDPPEKWGIQRGYWEPWYVADRTGVERPAGLVLTSQFLALDVTEAEDRSLALGHQLGHLTAYFVGAPPQRPRLKRIAEVTTDDTLLAQWDYFYDSESPPSIRVQPRELNEFLRKLAETDKAKRATLELAMRWYALSTAGQSVLDQYLSIWIGLEAIGPILAEYYHPGSPKVHCAVCQNVPGKDRDRSRSAVEHLIRQNAPEAFEEHTLQSLYDLRSAIVHPPKPRADLEREVEPLVPALQLCLGAGILGARSGPIAEPLYGWKGALPRDYEERPDARGEIVPSRALPDHKPFFGEWIDLTRDFEDRDVGVNETGEYHRFGDVRIGIKATAPKGMSESEFARRYVLFQRSGVTYELTDKNVEPVVPIAPEAWRTRPEPPAWIRLRKREVRD